MSHIFIPYTYNCSRYVSPGRVAATSVCVCLCWGRDTPQFPIQTQTSLHRHISFKRSLTHTIIWHTPNCPLSPEPVCRVWCVTSILFSVFLGQPRPAQASPHAWMFSLHLSYYQPPYSRPNTKSHCRAGTWTGTKLHPIWHPCSWL